MYVSVSREDIYSIASDYGMSDAGLVQSLGLGEEYPSYTQPLLETVDLQKAIGLILKDWDALLLLVEGTSREHCEESRDHRRAFADATGIPLVPLVQQRILVQGGDQDIPALFLQMLCDSNLLGRIFVLGSQRYFVIHSPDSIEVYEG